jgi:hypothetical protein
MLHRPRVQAAIEAETKRIVKTLGPLAVSVIREILLDKEHKDRWKAANGVVNRIDPQYLGIAHAHQHAVDITVREESADVVAMKILRHMREHNIPREVVESMLGANGLPAIERMLDGESKREPVTIDGETVETVTRVTEDSAIDEEDEPDDSDADA